LRAERNRGKPLPIITQREALGQAASESSALGDRNEVPHKVKQS